MKCARISSIFDWRSYRTMSVSIELMELLTLREMCGPTYTFLSLSNMPLTDLMAFSAASAVS